MNLLFSKGIRFLDFKLKETGQMDIFLFIKQLRIREQVGCLTQLSLTIQIEEVLFDSHQKLECLTRI